MPKIIPALKETIIETSRRIMFEPDNSSLTIRNVAQACGVAVGTVYNYFPSKDVLIASVILDDWVGMLNEVVELSKGYNSAMQVLERLYAGLRGFVEQYNPIWMRSIASPGAGSELMQRHLMVISTLAGAVVESVRSMRNDLPESICRQAAVIILESATNPEENFEDVRPALEKLLA